MKSDVSLGAIIVAMTLAVPALAKDSACLIEGSFAIMGQKIQSKDCMQADPAESESAFKKSCSQLAATAEALGGAAGKITYLANCPQPSQGVCAGFMGGKRDAYYYARTGIGLTALPSSCANIGGRWRSGGG